MTFKSLRAFYNGELWDICKKGIATERADAEGFIRCEICGKRTKAFIPKAEADNRNALVYHHKIPLTIANVNNFDISLNPEKIQCLCWKCHNDVHNRFTRPTRNVYIVTGAPLSGKSSFVKENMTVGDLIYDLDSIWQAISGQERYIKPKGLYPFVDAMARELKAQIKMMRNGTAWVITGAPSASQRQSLARELDGEVIHIDTDKTTCLERLHESPSGRDIQLWTGYIEEYFDRYTV